MSFIAVPLLLSTDTATDVDTNTESFAVRAQDIDYSEYSVSGLTLPNAKIFSVSHETGKQGEQRTRVRIDRTEVDTVLVPATLSVSLVLVRPVSTAITNAIIIKVINQLVDFLVEGGSNANVTSLLNREV